MTTPEEFDEIRPYGPEDLPEVYESLIADSQFEAAMKAVFPDIPFGMLAHQLRGCRTNLDFQKTFCYPFLKKLLAKASTGLDSDFSRLEKGSSRFTFISNHRDIVLDSALLDLVLVEDGRTTVEIAIGDNLLIFPWIKRLVRVNKSFIVQRALTMRQMLMSSMRMSRYMHFAVEEKGEGIWIAQREGRAKDSDDRTQDSILKMMAMGGEGSVVERLKSLHIVPLAISYEYDPCDWLKAKEFQSKRDIEGFKKSQKDDLDNMQAGIMGYKGHIRYQAAEPIDAWLDTLDEANTPKSELFDMIAKHIDAEIHKGYELYPCNWVAADMLRGGFQDRYSQEDRARFEKYLDSRIALIQMEGKDEDYLRRMILLMYANPVFNKLAALG